MLAGSIVALVTPMSESGALDWPALDALVDWHVEQGTDAIVAVGTTGESATLDVDEHMQVIERIIARADKRVPVIAGTGANSTREAIMQTKTAAALGADACLLVTPYYNKPTQGGMYQHFKKIADSVAVPQLLYNVPGRTSCDMLNATVSRLADIDNIVGIKDATGDLQRGRDLVERCADRIAIYSGDDATAIELMLAGGRGNISVTANIVPAQMNALCAAALGGDTKRAREINATIGDLHRALFLESNPIPVKWALQQMGKIGPGLRLPLTPLAAEFHTELAATLQSVGVEQLTAA
ncbi:MAG: 4-hydroxy-tetrahydrodipicolinate synthase [Pseudomonadales bacterium]